MPVFVPPIFILIESRAKESWLCRVKNIKRYYKETKKVVIIEWYKNRSLGEFNKKWVARPVINYHPYLMTFYEDDMLPFLLWIVLSSWSWMPRGSYLCMSEVHVRKAGWQRSWPDVSEDSPCIQRRGGSHEHLVYTWDSCTFCGFLNFRQNTRSTRSFKVPGF